MTIKYYPVTPGSCVLIHLESESEDEAWQRLMEETARMPYGTKEGHQQRGYHVVWGEVD